jgi:DNA mismatch endonuclease (patch repair protein)
MVDVLTREQRHLNMRRIRGRDTAPELEVRSILRTLGLNKYRLHAKSLPGKPDIVFPRWRRAIFVHGCYWHRHSCPYGKITPDTNRDFWLRKFESNKRRDRQCKVDLHALGWRFTTVWECQLKSPTQVRARLSHVMRAHGTSAV